MTVSLSATALVAAAVVAALVLTVAVWAAATACRLDRLHVRVDRTTAALHAALDRRMAVVVALAPELGPQARKVEDVALKPGNVGARIEAERQIAGERQPVAGLDQHPEMIEADHRVELAARFYNDAVAVTRALRLNPAVRLLRLAGTAPLPEFCHPPGAASPETADGEPRAD